jgi:exodeoxyribonuclease VIII
VSNYKGIVKISNELYHAEKKHISSSNLKSLLKDPGIFYKEKILGDRKEHSNATQGIFDDGTLAHTLILEPEEFHNEFRVFPGFRKQGKDWEVFKNDPANNGYVLVSKSQKAKVEAWVESYRRLPTAVNLIKGGFSEHTLFGELMGVPIKVRADYINIDNGYIADVKTTSGTTDVDGFKYTVESFEYDLSAALYSMMFKQHYGKDFEFYFVVLGKRDKSCEVFKLSEASRVAGELKVLKALKTYKECKESGIWSLTGNKVNDIVEDESYEILEV